MLIWFFTVLDVLVFFIVLFAQFGIFEHWRLLLAGAGYLILKGLAFKGDLLSTIDLVFGIYILLMLIGARWLIVSLLLLIWLFYKTFITFTGY